MARKLDLRSGKPVWFAYPARSVPTSRLSRDIKCDVLVIGMGISGAMIAEALARMGQDVVAVDRRRPMLGSTSATTALVQYEIDQPLSVLSHQIGREKAERAWRRSRLAVANLHGRIAMLDIKCKLALRPSLFLAGTSLSPEELKEEALKRREAGIDCSYLTHKALENDFGLDRKAAIYSPDNIALDPRRLTSGLLRKAQDHGARFYHDTEITRIDTDATGVTAESAGGATIRCSHLVVATGYELLDIVPAKTHRIISTWAIATKPQPGNLWPRQAFIWEASDPYLYMRTTDDGRIICGGEDEEFTDEEKRNGLTEAKSKAIGKKLARLLPNVDTEAEFAWSGSFGVTPTGLPYIGTIPRRPRIHAVMGYGGNGITYSQMASEIVATTIAGGQDRDSDLFAFDT